MKQTKFQVLFVEKIPPFKTFEEGTLYVCIPYKTIIHKCMCGCGSEIVTPIAPTGWNLTYDGDSFSLSPSIGNLNYPCKSHYYLRNNRLIWLSEEKPTHGHKKSKKQLNWIKSFRNKFK